MSRCEVCNRRVLNLGAHRWGHIFSLNRWAVKYGYRKIYL